MARPSASLAKYRQKRDFSVTPEPPSRPARRGGSSFVIQKHAARRLHYDFRLELDGTLKSWAVTKGPSLDPATKRLAVHVEDHPVAYGGFEGTIPQGQYGGGTVMIWDQGSWEPIGDAHEGYRRGQLKFLLHGKRLEGRWVLVRMGGRRAGDEKHDNWLLIKERDEFAKPGDEDELLAEATTSAASGRTMAEIASAPNGKVWHSNRGADGASPAAKAAARAPSVAALAAIPGAKRGALPDFVAPQLATLVKRPPSGENWLHEIKFDGYRVYARRAGDAVALLTRSGQDWTERFAPIAQALRRLPGDALALDGEIVVLDTEGRSSFRALQRALGEGEDDALRFVAFDLLHLNDRDLRGCALRERKRILRELLGQPGIIVYSDDTDANGEDVYRHACEMKLEGIVSKRADLPYRSGRSASWVKTKCTARQEFVIGGFTEPKTAKGGIGALLIGYYEDEQLRYAGRVGTGFTREAARDLRQRLGRIERDTPPFAALPGAAKRGAHWVEPQLACEVDFLAWTADGVLRHPSFQGLREDKQAATIGRDAPDDPPARKAASPSRAQSGRRKASRADGAGSDRVAGIQITHADRVVFPEDGITKLQLAQYHAAVARWMLPQIENRPLSLLRCPEGMSKQCFFQKHFATGLHGLPRVSIEEKHGAAEYVFLRSERDLIALIQEGIVEIHPWGAGADAPDEPDQVIFDLDPAPDVGFAKVVETAHAIRGHLAELGLRSFAKTTGGKGLHVVVPLRRGVGWQMVKDFARAIGENFVKAAPQSFTINARKDTRQGKIYIDYLRNDRGSTAIAPYGVRARPGAPVAMPLDWREITPRLDPQRFRLATVPDYLARRKADPWQEMAELRQTISAAARRALGIAA